MKQEQLVGKNHLNKNVRIVVRMHLVRGNLIPFYE